MRKKVRRGLMLLLAVALAVGLAAVAMRLWDYREGEVAYAEAESIAGAPDLSALPAPVPVTPAPPPSPAETGEPDPAVTPEPTPEPTPWVDPYADALAAMDFSALREVNEDVLGWLLLPGTTISYPLLQGEDNDYYLNHTWRGSRSSVGAIFMECWNDAGLGDYNTIIYGHRMMDRSMFGPLKNYSSQDFWSGHPYIYITDDSGSHQYRIFAAYEASVEGQAYHLSFSDEEARQAFIDESLEQSVIDTGLTPTTADRFVTLSTCTGKGYATRWIVQGYLPAGE